jgi:hypothetical protein
MEAVDISCYGSPVVIGDPWDPAVGPLYGDLYEVIAVSGTLPDKTLASLEQHLLEKHALEVVRRMHPICGRLGLDAEPGMGDGGS